MQPTPANVEENSPLITNQLTDTRQQIIDNLKVLNISEESAKRILDTVDNMRGKDHIKGALKFLTQITNAKSKREDYYRYSNFIAEFFCTISNLGLFAVGIYYKDFAVLLSATFSALSHAIPLQRLHDLDILGVLIIFGKAIANYKTFMERPEVLAWGAGALTVNILDTVITRKYLDKIGPALHATWHLAAALALYKLDQATIEVTESEMGNLTAAIMTNTVPTFLNATYDAISNSVSALAKESRCTIV